MIRTARTTSRARRQAAGFRWLRVFALGLAASMLAPGRPAHGQCVTTCPGGSQQQNDTCANPYPDANGGCSIVPPKIQTLGNLTPAAPINVCGSVGTFGVGQRDVDTFKFTLATPAEVRITVKHKDSGGTPAPNFVIALYDGADCATSDVQSAITGGVCPLVLDPVPLAAGSYFFALTVAAFGPSAPACPVTYVATVEVVSTIPVGCGPAAGGCGTPHGTPGCDDLACCASVCGFVSSCCDVEWDLTCVDFAFALCGLFDYSCIAPGPANDCAGVVLDAAPAPLDTTISFSNAGANTDGPFEEECDQQRDVWFLVKAPASGQLDIDASATTFDATLGVYAVGSNPVSFQPDLLPDVFLGCVDGPGGEVTSIPQAVAGDHYLVRVGGFGGATGTGTIRFTFTKAIFDTQNTKKVKFDSAGAGNFLLIDVGLVSGNLSAAQPQRWTAQAFTVPAAGPGATWKVKAIHAYGTTPQGVTNSTLEYVIWKRTGLQAPVAADQLLTGSVPFPQPTNIPGGAIDEDHRIGVDFNLAAGDYWLTVFAGAGAAPKNFNWYLNAPGGINNIDPNTGAARAWRSAMYPVPGFVSFTLPPATLMQDAGLDPNDLYNTGFRILAVPVVSPCPSDLDGSGCVDGADLGLMLGQWGAPYGGPELGQLLAAWGPCPGAPPGSCAP